MRTGRLLAVVVAVAMLGATAGARGSETALRIDPARFSARVDNPWFPLKPGTRYVYAGVKDGQPSQDVLVVTHQTRTIDGVPCVVVQDRLYLRGRLAERTTVIGSFNTVSPAGAPNAVLTEEWTPLEPGTLDNKLYVRGIGTVLEQTVKGGDERNLLVSVTKAG